MPDPIPSATAEAPGHPRFGRRFALQAGAIGLLGLSMDHVHALRALGAPSKVSGPASSNPRPGRSSTSSSPAGWRSTTAST